MTQRTAVRPFLSEILGNQNSWEHFLLDSLPESQWPRGAVPSGFPLRNGPPGYLPGQLFLSHKARWKSPPER